MCPALVRPCDDRNFDGSLDSRLPSPAAEKLYEMSRRVGDLEGMASRRRDEWDRARAEVSTLRCLTVRSADYTEAGYTAAEAERMANLAAAEGRCDRLFNDQKSVADCVRGLSVLVNNIKDFLDRAGGPFEIATLPVLSPDDTIETVRDEISRQTAELARIERAPRDPAEVKEAVRKQIDDLALRGRPYVAPAFGGAPVRLVAQEPTIIGGENHGAHHAFVAMGAVELPLIAWLFRDELVARLEAEIEVEAEAENFGESIAMADRPAFLAAAQARLYELGLKEELLIEQAGGAIDRRADADPRCVLMLR